MIYVTNPSLPDLDEYVEQLKKIWESKWLTNHGQMVVALEDNLKNYLGINNLSVVANGTLALQLALKAFNLQGEVITTPFTFVATTNAIIWSGLTPVFADVDPETYNIDPKEVEKRITKDTCAILAVHIYGNPCDVEELQKIADKHNIKLIYDAAHAFGVKYGGESVLNYGDASILSFHATKVFNTIEGGAIVAREDSLINQINPLRDFGYVINKEKKEENIVIPGINAKMNEFQAAMGLCNLKKVNDSIAKRKDIYKHYVSNLSDEKIKFQKIITPDYNYSYMPVCFATAEERDRVFNDLVAHDIRPRKYFYPLIVDFDFMKSGGQDLREKYSLDNSAYLVDRILCLPLYADLEISQVDEIIRIIKKSLKE